MLYSFEIIILILFALICCFFFFYHKRKLGKTTAALTEKLQKAESRLEEIESQKQKKDEKTRKLFQMSETVYKEKKKVDQEIEQIRLEKEKLEAQKEKVDDKIKKLWQTSISIHKEKEKVEKIKAVIELKHREVTDSITYAKRIQTAILPLEHEIYTALPESFVFYLPRDIVSGDFYWFTVKNEKIFLAAVDCTGHGVPGALMSMVGNTLLNEIVVQQGVSEPGKILNELDNNVRYVLKQDNSKDSTRDGMDICLCVFEKGKNVVQYAGANRPLWIIRKGLAAESGGGLEEIKATKAAIGGLREQEVVFQTHKVLLQTGDSIYLSSDGYADQFGSNDKKLMTRKFKELILSVREKPMQEQMQFLEKYHIDWKGNGEQTDDVLVMGVRI